MPGTILFRREVTEARRADWLGTISIAAPISRWLYITCTLCAALAVVLLLLLGHYTRRETIPGQLVPSLGLLNLSSPAAGTITSMQVSDGQSVTAGQILLEVSSDQDSALLGGTQAAVGRQLDSQRDGLKANLRNQQQLLSQQSDGLRRKISLLVGQLTEIDDQLIIVDKEIDANRKLLSRMEPLVAKGYISIVQVQQQQSALFDTQSQRKTLKRQELDIRQQRDAAEHELLQLPFEDETKRNDIDRDLASVEQSIARNEMQRATVLRAPRDGIISSVLIKAGQMVAAGQPLISIVPKHSVLQAQLLVPSRAIGFITAGNKVVLRYQAFPYQKFGQQFGRVTDISRSALMPTEVQMLTGQQVKEPLYRVLVNLDSQHVLVYGKEEPVKPGMALDADVLMERRSLLEWVFEPVYGIKHHMAGDERG